MPRLRVWNGLSGLRKDNIGYDLRNLFIGSEGTLGVITAATMKLAPLPAAHLTAWAAVASLEYAVQLLGLAHRNLGAGLTGFEVMNQIALGLVARHFPQPTIPLFQSTPWCVLLENSDHESEGHARAQFEGLLESALDAEFVQVTDALLRQALPGVRLVNFGHLGDGNLHYNVQAPNGTVAQSFLDEHEEHINTLVFDSVARSGGSISAEHGVGSLKVDQLEHHKSPVALDMMRAIKRALDPTNLMNPGRVIRP